MRQLIARIVPRFGVTVACGNQRLNTVQRSSHKQAAGLFDTIEEFCIAPQRSAIEINSPPEMLEESQTVEPGELQLSN